MKKWLQDIFCSEQKLAELEKDLDVSRSEQRRLEEERTQLIAKVDNSFRFICHLSVDNYLALEFEYESLK